MWSVEKLLGKRKLIREKQRKKRKTGLLLSSKIISFVGFRSLTWWRGIFLVWARKTFRLLWKRRSQSLMAIRNRVCFCILISSYTFCSLFCLLLWQFCITGFFLEASYSVEFYSLKCCFEFWLVWLLRKCEKRKRQNSWLLLNLGFLSW